MISRRELLRVSGLVTVPGLTLTEQLRAQATSPLSQRTLGRTGRWVTPLGLGGQASLQWTPAGIDPADIIVRAVELGVNYLDTANAYGPSQRNYGEAFRRLHLVPGQPDYNAALRERLYIASKTAQRYSVDLSASAPRAADELKTSLTVMFGDGKGYIPDGAYLDAIQIHHLGSTAEVDQIYAGMDRRWDRTVLRIGALSGLLDFRDGTNYTGLNPEHRQWVRHIGITGHQSSMVLMDAIRRDEANQIDTILVALNANDRSYCSHQHNVVPLARSKGMGVIAMKVFADGAVYGRAPRFSSSAADVNLSVGQPGGVSSTDLVRYPLSIPGVDVAIVGTGRIDRDAPENDQLVANLAGALMDPASPLEMQRIEEDVAVRHGTSTNYFQDRRGLVQPSGVKAERDGDHLIVSWNTAFAGAAPIRAYEVSSNGKVLVSLPFRPQLTSAPLTITIPAAEAGDGPFQVAAVE